MSTITKRIPPELRDPARVDHDAHANRLFEIAKEAKFAADPSRTAHALAQATMWLDGGSKSNVSLTATERTQLDGDLIALEIHAFRHLPEDFARRDVSIGFATMRLLVERWSKAPKARPTGDERANEADAARVWQNRLHSAVLMGDIRRRTNAETRREVTIAQLLNAPVAHTTTGLGTGSK